MMDATTNKRRRLSPSQSRGNGPSSGTFPQPSSWQHQQAPPPYLSAMVVEHTVAVQHGHQQRRDWPMKHVAAPPSGGPGPASPSSMMWSTHPSDTVPPRRDAGRVWYHHPPPPPPHDTQLSTYPHLPPPTPTTTGLVGSGYVLPSISHTAPGGHYAHPSSQPAQYNAAETGFMHPPLGTSNSNSSQSSSSSLAFDSGSQASATVAVASTSPAATSGGGAGRRDSTTSNVASTMATTMTSKTKKASKKSSAASTTREQKSKSKSSTAPSAAAASSRKRLAQEMIDSDDGGEGDDSDAGGSDLDDGPSTLGANDLDRDEIRKEKNRVKQRRLRLRRANRMTELEAECEAGQRRVVELERQVKALMANKGGRQDQNLKPEQDGVALDTEWKSWVKDLESEILSTFGAGSGTAKIQAIRDRAADFRNRFPIRHDAKTNEADGDDVHMRHDPPSSALLLRRQSSDGHHSDSASSHAPSLASRLAISERTSSSSSGVGLIAISPVSYDRLLGSSSSRSSSTTPPESSALVETTSRSVVEEPGDTHAFGWTGDLDTSSWTTNLLANDTDLYSKLLEMGVVQLPQDYAPILRDPMPFPAPTTTISNPQWAYPSAVSNAPSEHASTDVVQTLNAGQASNDLELLHKLQLSDVEHLTDKTALRLARLLITAVVPPDAYAMDVLANTPAAQELDRSITASEGLLDHMRDTWSCQPPAGPIDIADLKPTWRQNFPPVEVYILVRALMHACEPAGSKAFYDGKHKAEIVPFPAQTRLLEAWEAYEARDKRVELLPGVVLRLRVIMNDDLRGKGDLDLNALLTDMLHQGIIYGNAWSHYSWELSESFWTRWQPVLPAGRKFCNHLRTWRRKDGHLGVTPFQIIMGTELVGARSKHGVDRPPPGWQELMRSHFTNPR